MQMHVNPHLTMPVAYQPALLGYSVYKLLLSCEYVANYLYIVGRLRKLTDYKQKQQFDTRVTAKHAHVISSNKKKHLA